MIFGPAHYLKQFHKKYQDDFRLSALMKQNRVKKWADLHIKMSRAYRPENPDLPTLDPWRNTTPPPAEQFVFERNPFFHRVDENGMQLPYIDRFILNVSSSSIIAAKTGAGESDLQATGIDFNDYTFLKEAEKRFPVKVNLWKQARGSRLALLPNLNCADEVWRKLFRDVRFRRALSLAIDRHEINMVAFYGLGKPSADTVLPDSPLFKQEYADAYVQFDPDQANKLLDELGLTNRDSDGIRLLPDGRRAEITVETAGESTLDTDVLELVRDHWAKIGLALFTRTSQRDVFRSRAMSGTIMMSIWFGIENGVPTADMTPSQLAPTLDDQLQWPIWGMYYLSAGQEGSRARPARGRRAGRPAQPVGLDRRLPRSAKRSGTRCCRSTPSRSSRSASSTARCSRSCDSAKMQNVPERALYGFDPTSYLGVYMPDTFWLQGGLSVLRYILWRIAAMVPTLIVISALVFTIIELPPGDFFESQIAELRAQGETCEPAGNRGAAQAIRFRQAGDRALLLLGRRHAAGRFRLFVRISAAGFRRGRRPPVADDPRLLHDDPAHLADRLPDRHLFRHPPI